MRVWNLIHWWPSDSLLFGLQTSKIIAHKFFLFFTLPSVLTFLYALLNWVTCIVQKKIMHHKETYSSSGRMSCSLHVQSFSLYRWWLIALSSDVCIHRQHSAQIKLSLIYMAVKCHNDYTTIYCSYICGHTQHWCVHTEQMHYVWHINLN